MPSKTETTAMPVGRIDLGPIEPRHLTQTEQRALDGALRRATVRTGSAPDPLGIWIDAIPADIKHCVSLHDLMRLWWLARDAIGVKDA